MTTPTPVDRDLARAIRRIQDALLGITHAEAHRIAALDLAVRRTMDEPRYQRPHRPGVSATAATSHSTGTRPAGQ